MADTDESQTRVANGLERDGRAALRRRSGYEERPRRPRPALPPESAAGPGQLVSEADRRGCAAGRVRGRRWHAMSMRRDLVENARLPAIGRRAASSGQASAAASSSIRVADARAGSGGPRFSLGAFKTALSATNTPQGLVVAMYMVVGRAGQEARHRIRAEHGPI